jgi:MOSC domain-containing protein YiiM
VRIPWNDTIMTILRIRTGKVRSYADWTSAIEKSPVSGAVHVHQEGLEGDEQADRVSHGGPDKAILCYARSHYELWARDLGASAPAEGTLGENLEIEGASEESVCVGDIFRIGDVVVQVSQPRQPCWKPAALHGMRDLTARILKSGRTGWYLRVLETGTLVAPRTAGLIERPHPEWSVARATRVMHFEKDPKQRAELGELAALSESWRSALRAKA